jgi:small subunit ribosomal protein S2
LYCKLIADAVLDGLQQEMIASGEDVGAAERPIEEAVPEAAGAEAVAEAE